MASKQEMLELEILKFFKQSLSKYIHTEQHLGFKKRFSESPSYSAIEIQQTISSLIEKQFLIQNGNLLSLSSAGSDKSCEDLYKNNK
ncbi:MAG: hypothetical protein K0R66_1510 [Gammaproteobacteria bacterium]|jgi:hypothetical protein|nr:hypothetical protein [Gammaproteobacteria bacterium]